MSQSEMRRVKVGPVSEILSDGVGSWGKGGEEGYGDAVDFGLDSGMA